MAIPLKYNTASQEIPLGYFVDSTDGNTEETGLTIANTDIKLWKAGATTLANKNSGGATHISNGIYYTTLDATDTNTYGPLVVFVHVSGALAIKVECVVMEANAYDALYAAAGTGLIEANAVQISGDATAANNLEADYDGTGYNKSNSTIGTCTTNTDLVTAAAIRTEIDSNSTQLAAIVEDTGTTLPASIATAQADLDTITGADGVTLATTQGAITWGAQTISVSGATNNITLAGSGTGDGMVFTRSGSGGLFGTNWAAALQQEAADALTAYDPPTKAEMDALIGTPAGADIATDIASVKTDTAAILTDTGTTIPAQITGLNDISVADVLTTQMTESYAADGTAPTLAQAIFLIQQMLSEKSVASTTLTVKKIDGSTTAATFTLNDGTSPTSITRST